jgi:hypothetical protein
VSAHRALRIAIALLVSLTMPARAVDLRHRSDSSSRQFTIYCEDIALRQRVATFAEEVKADLAQLLAADRSGDRWKTPIVITLARAGTLDAGGPSVALRPLQSDFGFKIEIHVQIGDDPAAVFLQKQILRALLLGYSYGSAGIRRDESFVEAPWWVIEGALQIFQRRELGMDATLFKQLLAAGQLPPIADFLAGKPAELGPAALATDRACALALIELLVEQPGGRDGLSRLIRDWPRSPRDPIAALAAAFPQLGGASGLQRWWTLSLARLAAADRHEGLSIGETDRELTALIRLTLTLDKSGQRRGYRLEEYRDFLKHRASRDALLARQSALVALSARANALFRPVIAEYEQIVTLLARGKTRGLEKRIAAAEALRAAVVQRLSDIEDYLNWFEATQLGARSDTFDSYLQTAQEVAARERRSTEAITRYLDQIEGEL